jgi:ketopantoate reductase
MSNPPKKTVLVIGGGSVGAIAALNLEVGGLATVTVVLRSNYQAVKENGYEIRSCDHGEMKAWRPSFGMFSLYVPTFCLLHSPPSTFCPKSNN